MSQTPNRLFERCPNCDADLDDKYKFCPQCGQENLLKIVSMKTLLMDFLGDYFTFDAKFFTSFIPLLTKPGQLTIDYLIGKRQRYIPPLRIFIFSSIVFVFILSLSLNKNGGLDLTPNWQTGDNSSSTSTNRVPIFNFSFDADPVENLPDSVTVDSLNTALTNALNEAVSVDTLDSVLGFPFAEADSLINDSLTDEVIAATQFFRRFSNLIDSGYTDEEIADSLVQADGYMRHKMVMQLSKIVREGGSEGLIGFMISNATLGLLLALPVFALILKLLYVRRKQFYVSHFIFASHFHAFMMITLIVTQLTFWIWDYYPWWLLLSWIPYLYVSLYRVYVQSWVKTFFKMLLLTWIYLLFFIPSYTMIGLAVSFLLF